MELQTLSSEMHCPVDVANKPVADVLSNSVATEVAALGVSGTNPPLSQHADLDEGQMLLDEDNLKTTILSLPVSQEAAPSSSQIHHTANLIGNAEEKDSMAAPAGLPPATATYSTGPTLTPPTSGGVMVQSPVSSNTQLQVRNSSKHPCSPSNTKVHTRSTASNYQSRGHTPRGTVMPNSMYYRYFPVQIPSQPVYYQQATSGSGGQPHHQQPGLQGSEQLSSTNLYIRGLSRVCSDDDLLQLCKGFGRIVSTKSILDKNTSLCKGYGFVDFENPADALRACQSLQGQGIIVQFAKVPQQDQDPTNLYISNLPSEYDEKMIENLISPYGKIISTRILRDNAMNSRGVGFARMDSKESCEKVIGALNGVLLHGGKDPLTIKFADSSNKKKQSQNRWRDVQQQYIYEAPQVIPQNGLISSRGIVQHFTTPYVQTSPHAIQGYQVPVSNMSSTGWSPAAATYFMQPTPAVGSSDTVNALSAQMNGLQMGSTTGYATVQQPPATQYHFSPQHGAAQYAPQQAATGGWAISHQGATYLAQDHSAVPDPTQTNGADSAKAHHHIQVITQGETSDDHTVHLYYPSNTWTGK